MSPRPSKAASAKSKDLPVWRQTDGKPVSCLEKIKVLNQNIREIETLCADALEDGVLMGCDAGQIKAALHELIGVDAEGAAYNLAAVYAARGETDLAFEWLERAYIQRDPDLSGMKAFLSGRASSRKGIKHLARSPRPASFHNAISSR